MTTAGFAQSSGGQYVLTIQSPANGSGASGAMTVTGTAVDCATGQPASRVAVYDGPNLVSNAYHADVSMDTPENVGNFCAGRSGTDKIGFTLIYDTTALVDGGHNLTFMAQYPSGGSQTAGFDVVAYNNQTPYAQTCGYQANCNNGQYYGSDYLYGNGGYNSSYNGTYYGNDYLYTDATGYSNNNYQYGSNLYGNSGLYAPAQVTTVNGLGTQSVQCASVDMAGNCLSYQNVGVNTGTVQCVALNSAGQCASYQNVGTAGLQCTSADVAGNCLTYANSGTGAITGGVGGTCVLTSQGTCLQTTTTTTSQSVLPCPGNPMARCLFTGGGGYTVIP